MPSVAVIAAAVSPAAVVAPAIAVQREEGGVLLIVRRRSRVKHVTTLRKAKHTLERGGALTLLYGECAPCETGARPPLVFATAAPKHHAAQPRERGDNPWAGKELREELSYEYGWCAHAGHVQARRLGPVARDELAIGTRSLCSCAGCCI